ncbi:GIY-YIG nuclease family protein [Arsenicicoccus dermatophilus]|uniref:GIY-YIG nuclease family protein n=1 Tax=Arsenicicoccus dermatophilus TaxID=1076331 RepID=UPI003916EF4D
METNEIEEPLTLGHLLRGMGVALDDVLAVRHTYQPDGIPTPAALTNEALLDYTRFQAIRHSKIPAEPPRFWLTFMAEAGRYSRLVTVFENHGEIVAERTENGRAFDLRPVPLFAALENRLLIEWPPDTRNWAKTGHRIATCTVEEIAAPRPVAFPGYNKVLLTFAELRQVTDEPRYEAWRAALKAVRGIYLIVDRRDGKAYVGKADGEGGVMERWAQYAATTHGHNVRMKDAYALDPSRAEQYQFSLLRVFGTEATRADVDQAETQYKAALLTRQFGLNAN